MLRNLLIGIIICVLSIFLFGCQPVTKKVDETSDPKTNTSLTVKNSTSSKAESEQDDKQLSKKNKITVSEMESVAFEAAKKAKNTVPGWRNAEFRLLNTERIRSIEIPNDIFSLDDYNKKLKLDVYEKYSFLFQDISVISSFLYIYVDSDTGNAVGCYYTPEIEIGSFKSSEAKVTVTEAEEIALEAAKKAKNTVPYWKNAKVEHSRTNLISDSPNYVYPLDKYPTGSITPEFKGIQPKQLDLKENLKYEVWFRDANEVSSFLLIYIDAVTGEIMGCKIMSD